MEALPSELELIEAQIHWELHAGEYGPHIHGVRSDMAHEDDGKPMPIGEGRDYKLAILRLRRDQLRRQYASAKL